jgi:hypothetical protein
MGSIIFYPFSMKFDNNSSFLMTLQLAQKTASKVICFSVVEDEKNIDDAYLHLLNLNGYYQTTVNKWQPQPIQIETAITTGELKATLLQYLKNKKVDIIIDQPLIQGLKGSLMKQLLKRNIQLYSFFDA